MVGMLLVLGVGACGAGTPQGSGVSPGGVTELTRVVRAANQTVLAKGGLVRFSAVTAAGSYRLRGRLDLRRGYRICARVEQTPPGALRFYRRRLLWIQGLRGSYDDLIRSGTGAEAPGRSGGCPAARWFDDHPPTLPLFQSGLRAAYFPAAGLRGAESGAEFFLQAASLALSDLGRGAVAADVRPLGSSPTRSYVVKVDFARFVRQPNQRNEDSRVVRPLL